MTPRYSIGETVFYIENGAVEEKKITAVTSVIDVTGNYFPNGKTYTLKGFNYSTQNDFRYYEWKPESSFFPSKEELIKSL